MAEKLEKNYQFEDELLKEWKKPKIFNNNDNNITIIKKNIYLISTLIYFVVGMFIVLKYVDFNGVNASVSILLIFIVLSLIGTVHIENSINFNLSKCRNIEKFSAYLDSKNIRTVEDYDKLIKRFKSKKDKLVKIKLVDGFYSDAIIGVISFFIGGFLDRLLNKGIDKNQINGEGYIVITLFVICLICMLRLVIASIDSSLNEEYENLTLLIDDLEKIKYIKEGSKSIGNVSDNKEISSDSLLFDYIDNIEDAIYKLEEVHLRLEKINNRVEKLFPSEDANNIFENKEDSKDSLCFKQTIYRKETKINSK